MVQQKSPFISPSRYTAENSWILDCSLSDLIMVYYHDSRHGGRSDPLLFETILNRYYFDSDLNLSGCDKLFLHIILDEYFYDEQDPDCFFFAKSDAKDFKNYRVPLLFKRVAFGITIITLSSIPPFCWFVHGVNATELGRQSSFSKPPFPQSVAIVVPNTETSESIISQRRQLCDRQLCDQETYYVSNSQTLNSPLNNNQRNSFSFQGTDVSSFNSARETNLETLETRIPSQGVAESGHPAVQGTKNSSSKNYARSIVKRLKSFRTAQPGCFSCRRLAPRSVALPRTVSAQTSFVNNPMNLGGSRTASHLTRGLGSLAKTRYRSIDTALCRIPIISNTTTEFEHFILLSFDVVDSFLEEPTNRVTQIYPAYGNGCWVAQPGEGSTSTALSTYVFSHGDVNYQRHIKNKDFYHETQIENTSTPEISTQEIFAQEISAQEISAQEISAQEISAQEISAQEEKKPSVKEKLHGEGVFARNIELGLFKVDPAAGNPGIYCKTCVAGKINVQETPSTNQVFFNLRPASESAFLTEMEDTLTCARMVGGTPHLYRWADACGRLAEREDIMSKSLVSGQLPSSASVPQTSASVPQTSASVLQTSASVPQTSDSISTGATNSSAPLIKPENQNPS